MVGGRPNEFCRKKRHVIPGHAKRDPGIQTPMQYMLLNAGAGFSGRDGMTAQSFTQPAGGSLPG